jgi:hypothetical protein
MSTSTDDNPFRGFGGGGFMMQVGGARRTSIGR